MLLTKLKTWVWEALFPPTCLNCKKIIGEKENGLCAVCFATIPLNKTFFCGVCRARLANNRKICHKNAPYILAAACSYQNEIVRKLIWQLKYRQKKQAALPLARILATYINLTVNITSCDDVILGRDSNRSVGVCTIPLHSKRERERGFNQSQLIATHFITNLTSSKDTIRLINHILIRVKDTPPQAEIGDSQKRKENMEGGFSLYLPAGSNPIRPIGPICPLMAVEISGKNIILLDDVSTSGATLAEAARVLKAAGAKKIIGLVVAKA